MFFRVLRGNTPSRTRQSYRLQVTPGSDWPAVQDAQVEGGGWTLAASKTLATAGISRWADETMRISLDISMSTNASSACAILGVISRRFRRRSNSRFFAPVRYPDRPVRMDDRHRPRHDDIRQGRSGLQVQKNCSSCANRRCLTGGNDGNVRRHSGRQNSAASSERRYCDQSLSSSGQSIVPPSA